MDPPHGVGIGRIREVHAGTHDVAGLGASLGERRDDDVEATVGLLGDALVAGPVQLDGRGPGHEHPVADTDGATEADRDLVG